MATLYLSADISDNEQAQTIAAEQGQQHAFVNNVIAVPLLIIDKTP